MFDLNTGGLISQLNLWSFLISAFYSAGSPCIYTHGTCCTQKCSNHKEPLNHSKQISQYPQWPPAKLTGHPAEMPNMNWHIDSLLWLCQNKVRNENIYVKRKIYKQQHSHLHHAPELKKRASATEILSMKTSLTFFI